MSTIRRLIVFLSVAVIAIVGGAIWLRTRPVDDVSRKIAETSSTIPASCTDRSGARYSEGAMIRNVNNKVVKCAAGRWISVSNP